MAVPAVIAAFVLGSSLTASAQDEPPPKTPEEVIALMIGSDLAAFSGQFRATIELGLPELPDTGPGTPGQPSDPTSGTSTEDPSGSGDEPELAEMLSMLSGTHEARVYRDGPDKARLQVLEDMAERDYVLNGTSLWIYSSADNTATHTTLPHAPSEMKDQRKGHWDDGSSDTPPTPDQLAEKFLDAAETHTTFTVEDGNTVAGRDVYTLLLTPKTDQTLVAGVEIGVDAETGVPLAVTVDAVDQAEPAIDVAYTTFTPEAPDPALFEFEPPAGATVEERTLPERGQGWKQWGCGRGGPAEDGGSNGTADGCGDGPRRHGDVDGKGWDAVVQVPADRVPADLQESALLDQLATKVDGGYLIHTSLVNVLVTDEGTVYAGSVPLARLQAVAGNG